MLSPCFLLSHNSDIGKMLDKMALITQHLSFGYELSFVVNEETGQTACRWFEV